jgi:hypothetical protein
MQRIFNGAFDGLVMFGERPVGKGRERRENAAHALGIHDERAHVILGVRIGLEVRDVVAHPLLRGFVPPDLAP